MQPPHICWAVAGLMAAAAAFAVCRPQPAVAAPRGGPPLLARSAADLTARHALRVVAFGSSSTEGIGASSPAASYPSRLQVELVADLPAGVQVKVLNRGIGGEDAEDMLRRVPGIVAERPDLVIWQTGTNDPLRGLPLARFSELTRRGIAAFQAAGIDVMLMEPQDCPVFSAKTGALAYRDAVRAIGTEAGVPVVRRYDLMDRWLAMSILTRAQMQAPDGLHMSDAAYALLAKTVARAILADMAPLVAADSVLPKS
jgi:lysophospholipase L1-like esterase